MTKPRICPHCGQAIRTPNAHSMDRAKVQLLEQVAKLNRKGVEWVKVQRDGNLIRAEEAEYTIQCDDVHALRLCWFRLLRRKAKRSGLYQVTNEGFAFLCGTFTVPKKIHCLRGKVVDFSHECVHVHDVRDVVYDKSYWAALAARSCPPVNTDHRQGSLFQTF
jgi:hypothetical protein